VGGTENFVKNLLFHWSRNNDTILVCTFYLKNNLELTSKLENKVNKFIPLKDVLFGNSKFHFIKILIRNSFLPYFYKLYQLKKIISNESPDIILIQGEDSELLSGFLNKRIKKVNFIHSEVDFPKNILYRFILNSFSRKRFNYTFTVNKKLTRLPRKYNIKHQVIKPFIDESYFKFNSHRIFDRNKINIGYIGRIVREKGLKELLLAFSIVKMRFLSAKLYFAGDGKYLEKLKYITEKKSLFKEVTFLNEISEPLTFYNQVDIVVLPSRFEALPLILLEAMAVGCVVITTNVGGVFEIINNETNGLLLENNSPESISNAIFKIIENDALRERLRKNGYETVKKFFCLNFVDQVTHCLKLMGIDRD
jgi:glycosyltransferase involved in cell wall biosynthesis